MCYQNNKCRDFFYQTENVLSDKISELLNEWPEFNFYVEIFHNTLRKIGLSNHMLEVRKCLIISLNLIFKLERLSWERKSLFLSINMGFSVNFTFLARVFANVFENFSFYKLFKTMRKEVLDICTHQI
jgi:hypothetical protein